MASRGKAVTPVRFCQSFANNAMERLAQYWDDLDDLLGLVALCAERIRRFMLFLLCTATFFAAVYAGMMIALQDPPLALAIVTILLVFLMYRSVTSPRMAAAGS